MTSHPGPGIPESLQHRGSGVLPLSQVRRRPSKPINNTTQYARQQDGLDSLEGERRPTEEIIVKTRAPGITKIKPAALDSIHTNDLVRPPPRGKPPLFFSSLASNGHELPTQSPHGQLVSIASNLPVPPRPGSSLVGDPTHQPRILPGGTGVKDDAVVKPPSPDAPPPAILFSGGGTADFFPYIANSNDDILTEPLVKQGISNKPQIMNETNTARPSLWTNLKNKSGLSTLSTLFVAVLEKRQACGRLTAANTFKPPPRLTLRDSTREAWLHDLANPTVGLRRLSRTIPHGITGKVLLEQCLNKNIPIPRAMWLAKCVGINEMRSHQRKGQAGTITWVRGWTSSVEQFLDSTIATIGQRDWKPRITYALQLVTHLYKDHLLEEEHFLDWILKNLDSCLPERLFLWLLLVSIYWLDLTSSRRRSKRLAESLLNHAEKLYRPEEADPVSPVLQLLEEAIFRLLLSSPVSLLLPRTWDKHGPILHTLSQRRPLPQISHIVADLEERNIRLQRVAKSAVSDDVNCPDGIYNLLDSVDCSVNVRINELAYHCMELVSDANRLVAAVLRWASSYYREGSHRVYLVARLLRKWSHLGADIDEGILSYLHSPQSSSSSDPHILFRIVAELIRSKTFSTGRYLQWLIATGTLGQESDPSTPLAWPVRLISEIPLSGLPEQVRILRSTLLRGTGYSVEDEEQALSAIKGSIRQQASRLFGMEPTIDYPHGDRLGNICSSIQLEVGVWLREQIALNMEVLERASTKDASFEELTATCSISSHDFHVVRFYVEAFNDYSILADIISIVSTSSDTNVLISAVDTLRYHHRVFNAIGAFEPLFAKMGLRYTAIRMENLPERDLILCLTDLARLAREDTHLLQLLAYDLKNHDQKSSVAACSPASDNMAEAVQITTLSTEDEIDRIFASGTSMDRQIMTRLFNKIIYNLESQINKSTRQFGNHPIWFNRLRGFDEGTFDGILAEWLILAFTNHQAQLISAALPPLVSSGCLLLSKILEIVKQCVGNLVTTNPEEALRISITGLEAILPSDDLNDCCQLQDAYRYRLAQQKLCLDPKGYVLEAIQLMIEIASNRVSPPIQVQFTSMLLNKRLLAVVKHFAINDIQLLSTHIGIGVQPYLVEVRYYVKSLLDCLWDPIGRLEISQKSFEEQITIIVDSIDELSLPFCQLEIQQIFALDVASGDTSTETISSALLQAVKTILEKNQSSWSSLIAGLDANLTSKIREHAERELFNASEFLSAPLSSEIELPNRDDKSFIQKYLTVINFTANDSPKESQSFSFGALSDRIRGVTEALGKFGDISNQTENTLSISSLWSWLHALLHLAVVHSSILWQKAGNQHQATLLWSLRAIITHPVTSISPYTAQYVFDVALLLSDSIADEVRHHLSRLDALKPSHDSRCAFMFGTNTPPDGWLTLTKPSISPTTSQTITSPQAYSQHHSHSQSSQQHQQISPSPASLQRSLGQPHQPQQLMQTQSHGRVYPQYPQYPQQNKMTSQLQRMASNAGQGLQQTQLQQMQYMQGVAQLRSTQPSPIQQQRQSVSSSQAGLQNSKMVPTKLEKPEMKAVPFSLRRWEILPESGGNPTANETAISLSLFGARKV